MALHLRYVVFAGLVTDQAVGEPLLGRPVLEFLELNTRDILAAAAEKHSGVVDITEYFNATPKGKVARILDGVYHSEGGADDADLDEADGWLDLGPEDPNEKREVLKNKIDEARVQGMSFKGLEQLKKLLTEFGDVIKTKMDEGEPADIPPMRVNLKPNAIPVRSKQRRYPPRKKEFLKRYVNPLLRLGFVKNSSAPAWVSAPLIVPKRPPAMYRMTVDYLPVNSATVQTFWPMANIEAELADFKGSTAFASFDFCSGYWKAPLHPDSQPLFSLMTPNGIVMPTQTTQGGTNSAANFQEKVAECFAELRDNFKAWIDDYMIYARDEAHLLQIATVYSPFSYGVTSLHSGKAERIHCARLLNYRDSLLGTEVPKDMLALSETTEARYEVVEAIKDIEEAPDGLFFHVQSPTSANGRPRNLSPLRSKSS